MDVGIKDFEYKLVPEAELAVTGPVKPPNGLAEPEYYEKFKTCTINDNKRHVIITVEAWI